MSRTRVAASLVALVGGILVVVALLLGFSSVDAPGTGMGEAGDVSCGSIFGSEPTWEGPLSHYMPQLCSAARSDRQTAVRGLLVAGVVALGAGGALLLIDHRRRRDAQRRAG
jgi:hypothetical protein